MGIIYITCSVATLVVFAYLIFKEKEHIYRVMYGITFILSTAVFASVYRQGEFTWFLISGHAFMTALIYARFIQDLLIARKIQHKPTPKAVKEAILALPLRDASKTIDLLGEQLRKDKESRKEK